MPSPARHGTIVRPRTVELLGEIVDVEVLGEILDVESLGEILDAERVGIMPTKSTQSAHNTRDLVIIRGSFVVVIVVVVVVVVVVFVVVTTIKQNFTPGLIGCQFFIFIKFGKN